MIQYWDGEILQRGLNWNRGGEFVWFWKRKNGRRFRLYSRFDVTKKALRGITMDAVSYENDAEGYCSRNVRTWVAIAWTYRPKKWRAGPPDNWAEQNKRMNDLIAGRQI